MRPALSGDLPGRYLVMMHERDGGGRSILYICDFNAHGGTQTHLLHLFESIDRRRFLPSLAAPNIHPDLERRLSALDIEVVDLRLTGAFEPATLSRVAALAGRALRGRVDLLHGYLFTGNLLAAAVSRLSGVPCLTSVRNVDLWKKARHRFASSLAHRRARRVLFNSRIVQDYTMRREGIPAARTVVVYNGVRDIREGSLTARTYGAGAIIICVASLRAKKGHTHLIEAFRLARARLHGARLLLVGEGPMRKELEGIVAQAGLGDSVVFTGYRPDVGELLGGSDMFVLASLEEGMPNALLEAMAAGLPCVVTAVGGNSEVVEEGRTGFLVPAGRPEAMADRIVELLRDADLRQRMGALARSRFESAFTLERMTAAFHSLYDAVLAE